MKIIFGIAFVLMVTEVRGFFGNRGGNPGNGRGVGGPFGDFNPLPHPFHHDHPPISFPECKDFFEKIHDKLHENKRNNEPQRCPGKSREECFYEKLVKARLDVQEQPSESCMNQVSDFLTGDPSITTNSFSSTDFPEDTQYE